MTLCGSAGSVSSIMLAGAAAVSVSMSAASAQNTTSADIIARLTTNYVYRGYTKSDDKPTAQGNVDLQRSPGYFMGMWVSSVDFGGADLEFNPYLGKQFGLSPDWKLVGMLAGYYYDRRVSGQHVNYREFSLRLAYRDLGSLRLGVSPDYYGTGHTAYDYELELRYPLTDTVELSGTLGYQVSREAVGDDMVYGSVGIAWYIRRNLTLDLSYHDLHETNVRSSYSGHSDIFDENYLDRPVTLSVSVGF